MASQILEWASLFVQQASVYTVVSWLLTNVVIALNKAYYYHALSSTTEPYEQDDESATEPKEARKTGYDWLISGFGEDFISSLLETITSAYMAWMAVEGSILTTAGYWITKLVALVVPTEHQIPWMVLSVAFWIMLITKVTSAHANSEANRAMGKAIDRFNSPERFLDSVENPNSEFDRDAEFQNVLYVSLSSSEIALRRSITCSTILIMILITGVVS